MACNARFGIRSYFFHLRLLGLMYFTFVLRKGVNTQLLSGKSTALALDGVGFVDNPCHLRTAVSGVGLGNSEHLPGIAETENKCGNKLRIFFSEKIPAQLPILDEDPAKYP